MKFFFLVAHYTSQYGTVRSCARLVVPHQNRDQARHASPRMRFGSSTQLEFCDFVSVGFSDVVLGAVVFFFSVPLSRYSSKAMRSENKIDASITFCRLLVLLWLLRASMTSTSAPLIRMCPSSARTSRRSRVERQRIGRMDKFFDGRVRLRFVSLQQGSGSRRFPGEVHLPSISRSGIPQRYMLIFQLSFYTPTFDRQGSMKVLCVYPYSRSCSC